MNWNFDSSLLIQGIDQPQAFNYLQELNLENRNIKAGIGEGYGEKTIENIPVFDLVKEALAVYPDINTTLIFNHPYNVLDAGLEAIEAGIKQIIINTEYVPPLDLLKLWQKADNQQVKILGTSQAGILIPEQICWGVNNANLYQSGDIAIVNYGDSIISYELALLLQKHALGESIVINLGNDKFINIDWNLWLEIINNSEKTKSILINISDCSNINVEEFIKSIKKVTNKKILIHLLDPNNLKFTLQNNKAKIITDQIPQYLNRLLFSDTFEQILEENQINFTKNTQEIPLLLG